VMAPVFGSKPAKYDRAKVMGRKGVHSVLELPDGVAIVADRWWTAHSAVDDLNVEWSATGNDKTSDETISAQLWRDLKEQKGFLANKAGKPDEIFAGAKSVMTRRYEVPFLAHTTMEPMACVAKVDASSCEVWFASPRNTWGFRRPRLLRCWGAAASADVRSPTSSFRPSRSRSRYPDVRSSFFGRARRMCSTTSTGLPACPSYPR
jgi:hypothetical protein